MQYPNRIRELRLRSRLTQDELAGLVGITLSSVSKHEVGTRIPNQEQILAYARVFKIEPHELYLSSTDPRVPYTTDEDPDDERLTELSATR